MNSKKVIAVIFARGGSKGVKKKNIKLINNKPLIAYTIQKALRSKYIDDIYISTDSQEIADVAKLYGATIPFLRPKDLASDKSPEFLSWKHFVNYVETTLNLKNFIFIALPCVTPLKTIKNINDGIELYMKNDFDVVYTCMESFRNPYFNMVKQNDKQIELFMGEHKFSRRQDAPIVYDLTPSILVMNSEYIKKSPNIFHGNVYPLIVSKEEGIDIDDIYDFNLAELVIKRNSIDYIICGVGSIGTRHLKNIIKAFPDKKIGLLRREKIKLEEYPNIEIFTDFNDCIERNPKALIICTPSSYHMDIAVLAAKFNINTFIEKPLSIELDSKVNTFVNLVKEKKLKCMIGFDLRFHPGIIKLKELINKNTIGKIYSIEAQVGQYLPDWKPNKDYRLEMSAKKETGGGVLNDLIHEIDYVTYLIGEVKSVFGINNRVSDLEIETEDMAKILLNFKNGCVGYIHLDYLQKKYSRSCKIIGEKGTLEWNYVTDNLTLLEKDKKTVIDYTKIDRNQRFMNEIKYFINCIENNISCSPNEDIGYNTLKIIASIKKSSLENKLINII